MRGVSEPEVPRARLLYLTPQRPPSASPVIDDLTRRMTGMWRGRREAQVWRGWHTCVCGARSDSKDWWVGDAPFLTNALCVHYLAFHRDEVPALHLDWVSEFPAFSGRPDVEELRWPASMSPASAWGVCALDEAEARFQLAWTQHKGER